MVSMAEESHRITGPLREWHGGNQDAANQLMELVYGELHRIASRELRREGREHTLQTTGARGLPAALRLRSGGLAGSGHRNDTDGDSGRSGAGGEFRGRSTILTESGSLCHPSGVN